MSSGFEEMALAAEPYGIWMTIAVPHKTGPYVNVIKFSLFDAAAMQEGRFWEPPPQPLGDRTF